VVTLTDFVWRGIAFYPIDRIKAIALYLLFEQSNLLGTLLAVNLKAH
jgi:hypothetical protein